MRSNIGLALYLDTHMPCPWRVARAPWPAHVHLETPHCTPHDTTGAARALEPARARGAQIHHTGHRYASLAYACPTDRASPRRGEETFASSLKGVELDLAVIAALAFLRR